MIRIEHVYKRYMTRHGAGKWVLNDVHLDIPTGARVGLIGRNGAGKSTLLNLIGGMDRPTKGTITRDCRVSFPLGLSGGLQGNLSGRQNAKFVCRLFGHEDDMQSVLDGIRDYAELGASFDEPVTTYSSGMKARLRFAISLAFDFDVYIVDEGTAVGDAQFKKKSRRTFEKLATSAGLIMVAHDEKTLNEFCTAGIWLHEGHATWFDNVRDAIVQYRKSLK